MTESRTVASQPRRLWSPVAGGRSNPLPGQLWPSQLLQIGAFPALALAWPAGAVAQTASLYSDGFEDRPEVNVQVRGANQPYTARSIGLTQEKSHSGKTSVKIDVTTRHGFEVQLAPRTTAKPGVEWGSIGGAGTFVLPGLDIPLQRDRGYVLEAWVWVEKGPSSGVRIDVATVVDSHYGPVAASLVAGGTTKTGSWVKIEQELTASLLEKKDAAGDKVDGLRLQAVSYASFLPGAGELIARKC